MFTGILGVIIITLAVIGALFVIGIPIYIIIEEEIKRRERKERERTK